MTFILTLTDAELETIISALSQHPDLSARLVAKRDSYIASIASYACSYCGKAPSEMTPSRQYEKCLKKKCTHIICWSCACNAPRISREVRKYHFDSGQEIEYIKHGPLCKEHAANREQPER